MSEIESKPNTFKTFIKGYWEAPTEKPKLLHAFLRGAILMAMISVLFFRSDGLLSTIVWSIIGGLGYMGIDQLGYKMYKKYNKGA